MLAQAIPTPTIEASRSRGSEMRNTDRSPTAPHTRQMAWAIFRLVRLASTGMANATRAATPLYAANETPTQLAPSL